MTKNISKEVEHYTNELLAGNTNHTLIYGHNSNTLLKELYKNAKESNKFHTLMLFSKEINHSMDFFNPILKLKYNGEYESVINDPDFDADDLVMLSELSIDKEEDNKKTLVFIDGIEKLLFKMDYSHLDQESLHKVLRKSTRAPIPLGFGKCIRASWQVPKEGIIYGSIHNKFSNEYKTTLGNVGYAYYSEYFKKIQV